MTVTYDRFKGLNMLDLVLGQFAAAHKIKIEDPKLNLVDLTFMNLTYYTSRYIADNLIYRNLPREFEKRHSFHIRYDKLYDSIYKGEYDKVCNDMFDDIIKYATEIKDRHLVNFGWSYQYVEEDNDLEVIVTATWSNPIEIEHLVLGVDDSAKRPMY